MKKNRSERKGRRSRDMPLEYSTVGRIASQVLPQIRAFESGGSPLSLGFVVFPQEEPQTSKAEVCATLASGPRSASGIRPSTAGRSPGRRTEAETGGKSSVMTHEALAYTTVSD
jgi:hypothetical protein